MSNEALTKLKKMLSTVDCENCGCFLTDGQLSDLLTQYPCYELAAYHACILMAQRTDLRLSDGTSVPDQSSYWLRCALRFRPNSSRPLTRADEVCA